MQAFLSLQIHYIKCELFIFSWIFKIFKNKCIHGTFCYFKEETNYHRIQQYSHSLYKCEHFLAPKFQCDCFRQIWCRYLRNLFFKSQQRYYKIQPTISCVQKKYYLLIVMQLYCMT
eukprot:EC095815.1.p1 GENE.EC095815.1~~EC095815.1.p1  ORF type:complete len:116 (-),score=2.87 EC095815.1:143-490(-)